MGNARFLGNTARGSFKVRRLSSIIRRNPDLLRKYLVLCSKYGNDESDCMVSMNIILKNVLYSLYRRGYEPVATILEKIITRGYITAEEFESLVGGDVQDDERKERSH